MRLKIGVFDSGLGGLTVLKSFLDLLPPCDYIYLGDTARLPYGNKSSSTIQTYTGQNLNFLKAQKVDLLVIACNTASAHFNETSFSGIPVLTVIDPTATSALKMSPTKRIGILATRATVNSHAYEKALMSKDDQVQIFSMASPLLVPFAEEGLAEDPLLNLVSFRYVSPLIQDQIDCLILGCTHYPLLKTSLRKAAGNIPLIESGPAVAEKILNDFKPKTNHQPSTIEISTTDQIGHFQVWAEKILDPHQVKSWSQISV